MVDPEAILIPSTVDLDEFGATLRRIALSRRHRFCVLLCGTSEWAVDAIHPLTGGGQQDAVLVVSDRPGILPSFHEAERVYFHRTRQILGREYNLVIYDGFSGLDPDALGSAGGTIRAGGLLVLITPDFDQWPGYRDPQYLRIISHGKPRPPFSHYIQRFIRVASHSPGVFIIPQDKKLPDLGPWSRKKSRIPAVPDFSDQEKAVEAVIKVATGKRRRPVVLLADRGRGKSASLGIAAKQLLDNGMNQVIVTGKNRPSVAAVFRHAGDPGQLKYVPADQLIQGNYHPDLLLVDEAASIPVSSLQKLLARYPRIAFASTVHGYEGTGRGFLLRFTKLLDHQTRGWKTRVLHTPIRWSKKDPLERFLFRSLLLDAEPRHPRGTSTRKPECRVEAVEPGTLCQDERLLTDLFGLLTQAHYRTRPFDLRHLLDSNSLTIFRSHREGQTIGVALAVTEGGLDDCVARDVWKNQRRPNGHLLPELLCAQQGFIEAARLKFVRIMRIVVHPEFQRRGVGTELLYHIEKHFSRTTDITGTVFSATPEVMAFWYRCGYRPARIGMSNRHPSGSPSICLVRPVSGASNTLVRNAVQKFSDNLGVQLKTVLKNLDPALVPLIYRSMGNYSKPRDLTRAELESLMGFAYAGHPLDNHRATLERVWETTLQHPLPAEIAQRDLILFCERVLQGRDWKACSALPASAGRNGGTAILRQLVGEFLLQADPQQLKTIQLRFNLPWR